MRAVDDQHLETAAGTLAVHDAAGRADGSLHATPVRSTPGAMLDIASHCHASPAVAARNIDPTSLFRHPNAIAS